MRKWFFAIMGIGTACVACCLPIVSAWLISSGLAGGLAALSGTASIDQVICLGGPALGIAALLMLVAARRKRARRRCDCEATCSTGEC